MKIAIVINPASGRRGRRIGEGDARIALARRTLKALGLDAEVALTREPGHGSELSAAFLAAGADLIVAWGGDGTVNEVARPLIGSRAALGIVPSGSGDGLAHGLGLPADPARALEVALSGRTTAMDVGFLGGRPFLNVAGIGFDAAVGDAFNRAGKRGTLSYVSHALSLVWRYRSRVYTIELDGRTLTGERFVIGLANAREYGNRLVLDADADPFDGWLNMVIGDAGPVLAQVWRARRLAFRPRRPASGISRVRVQHARITGDELVCHVDGEAFTTSGTLDVTVAPGAIRMSAGTSRSSSKES